MTEEKQPEATADKLAQALREAGAPTSMIIRAREGYYDDFRSPLPFPITTLHSELLAIGLEPLAERVAKGEFDATKEEADAWMKLAEGQDTL